MSGYAPLERPRPLPYERDDDGSANARNNNRVLFVISFVCTLLCVATVTPVLVWHAATNTSSSSTACTADADCTSLADSTCTVGLCGSTTHVCERASSALGVGDVCAVHGAEATTCETYTCDADAQCVLAAEVTAAQCDLLTTDGCCPDGCSANHDIDCVQCASVDDCAALYNALLASDASLDAQCMRLGCDTDTAGGQCVVRYAASDKTCDGGDGSDDACTTHTCSGLGACVNVTLPASECETTTTTTPTTTTTTTTTGCIDAACVDADTGTGMCLDNGTCGECADNFDCSALYFGDYECNDVVHACQAVACTSDVDCTDMYEDSDVRGKVYCCNARCMATTSSFVTANTPACALEDDLGDAHTISLVFVDPATACPDNNLPSYETELCYSTVCTADADCYADSAVCVAGVCVAA
jgi:hypothetical protein